jgi:ribokinase
MILLAFLRKTGRIGSFGRAPARPQDRDLLALVDILTPSESEALGLLGKGGGDVEVAAAAAIARQLIAIGPRTVILKLGDKGAWVEADGMSQQLPTHEVEEVDATAAGDTFNGTTCTPTTSTSRSRPTSSA